MDVKLTDPAPAEVAATTVPLVVDLDGTLVKTDLLVESFFATLTANHQSLIAALKAIPHGKAHIKEILAETGHVDYTLLPYDGAVLALIGEAKDAGRTVYLATASDRRHAEAIAAHLGLFDGVFASDGRTNLSGEHKAARLIAEFGEGGFDYVGNSTADLPIWAKARAAYAIGTTAALDRKIAALPVPTQHLERPRTSPRTWMKMLRVHQYAKNALVFVPLLTSHSYSLGAIASALMAFLVFSLCASSVYILNDLVDLDSDRKHPTKRNRPFANGAIPLVTGMIAFPVLLVASFALAFATSVYLAGVLGLYFVLALAYSIDFKRRMIVDVVTLAMLYTIRVIAGAAAIPVMLSEWLLAFSMFIFTCLALVKRYTELAVRIDDDLPNPSNRNYKLTDISVVGMLAAASGLNSVTIFALYISSPDVMGLYRHPQLLWLSCPILIYWIGRILILAHRRIVHDDPIVFALRDRNSYLAAALLLAIILLAS